MGPMDGEVAIWGRVRRNMTFRKNATSAVETAQPIKLPFAMVSEVGPTNRVLGAGVHISVTPVKYG